MAIQVETENVEEKWLRLQMQIVSQTRFGFRQFRVKSGQNLGVVGADNNAVNAGAVNTGGRSSLKCCHFLFLK